MSGRSPLSVRRGRARGWWRAGVIAVAAATLITLTGCSQDAPAEPPTTAAPVGTLRVGGPEDCAWQATCLDALDHTYGLALSLAYLPLPPAWSAATALARGVLDVAIVDADDPELAAAQTAGAVTVLTDDRAALATQNVVAVVDQSVIDAFGERLSRPVGVVLRALSTGELAAMRAEVAAGRPPGEAAGAWLAARSLAPGRPAGDVTLLAVGTDRSVRNQLLAEAFARALTATGLPTGVTVIDGGRDAVMAALEDGLVALAPDLGGDLLETVNGFQGEAGPDPGDTFATLRDRLAGRALAVLEPSPVDLRPVVAVRRALADAAALASIGDLARLVPGDEVPAPSPPDENPPVRAPGPPGRREGIGLGATGDAVVAVQDRLRALGQPVATTGTFDRATQQGVAAVQRAAGLAPDGVWTPDVEATVSAAGPIGPATGPPRPGDPGTLDPPATDDEGRPVVYLTFAGGPDPRWTPALLAVLDEAQATATFLVTVEQARARPDLVRRLVGRGHAVAVDTRAYAALRPRAERQLTAEIAAAAARLTPLIGGPPTCLHPPDGALVGPVGAVAALRGWTVVLADVVTHDARRPPTDTVIALVAGAAPGEVVALTDGGGERAGTVEAVRAGLAALGERGVRATALPGCRSARPAGQPPEPAVPER